MEYAAGKIMRTTRESNRRVSTRRAKNRRASNLKTPDCRAEFLLFIVVLQLPAPDFIPPLPLKKLMYTEVASNNASTARNLFQKLQQNLTAKILCEPCTRYPCQAQKFCYFFQQAFLAYQYQLLCNEFLKLFLYIQAHQYTG